MSDVSDAAAASFGPPSTVALTKTKNLLIWYPAAGGAPPPPGLGIRTEAQPGGVARPPGTGSQAEASRAKAFSGSGSDGDQSSGQEAGRGSVWDEKRRTLLRA